jgi:DNA-binding transcriptional ArsR family regulator
MAFDHDRNRVLLSLRDRPEGVCNTDLTQQLGLSPETLERHLLYCADYGLSTWIRNREGKLAAITPRGRDYLIRQGL